MGDYNNPFENSNNQPNSSDPKLPENGQTGVNEQSEQSPYQNNPGGQDQNNQYSSNPYQSAPSQDNPYQNNSQQNNPYSNGQPGNQPNNPYQSGQYQDNQPQNNPYQNGQYQNNPYQNNPYQGNPYQNYSYQQGPQMKPQDNGMAIGSLVCGILSLLFSCCLWYLALPLSIAGLVLGILVIKNKRGGRSMAIAGIVLASIGILVAIVMAIFTVFMFTSSEFSNIYDQIYNELQIYN
ncbi:hypothetical protein HNQ56_001007 [Anaerotaenia torta]|uniref:DUF4190 domain-containing protein n=1 Tax=Anaerotaenia torta TaxID=433293 RepID=UPI003D199B32